jgi:transposase-like protein
MTIRLVCPYCYTNDIKPYGYDRHKIKRRYRCASCKKTFQNHYDSVGSEPGIESKIVNLIIKGETYLSVSNILGVSSKKIARAIRIYRKLEKGHK